jgi:hypothetical protein
MTQAEQNWRDGRPEDMGQGESAGLVERAHQEDPLVEQVYEEDPPVEDAGPPVEQAHQEDPLAEPAHEEDPLVEDAGPLVEQAHEEDPPAEPAHEASPPVEQVPAAAASSRSGLSAGKEPRARLVGADEAERFVARWQEIQAGFVDEPRRAVQDADALVADLMQQLAQMLASEREQLESHWATGVDVSTEDLRQGLRRYRSLFERLIAA